jgi:hypothetical protein
MPKFDVHIYAGCRIKVPGVEADSPVEACRKAEKETDLYHVVRSGQAEFDDDIHGFLADELDDKGERIAEHDLTAAQVDGGG